MTCPQFLLRLEELQTRPWRTDPYLSGEKTIILMPNAVHTVHMVGFKELRVLREIYLILTSLRGTKRLQNLSPSLKPGSMFSRLQHRTTLEDKYQGSQSISKDSHSLISILLQNLDGFNFSLGLEEWLPATNSSKVKPRYIMIQERGC